MKIDAWVKELPITEEVQEELQTALNRRQSGYWVETREIWHKLCAERLEEKKDRAIRKLLNDEKIFAIQFMSEELGEIVKEVRTLGYSVHAISEASHQAVSHAWVISNTETPACRIRGQVIELLEDLSEFDLRKWLLKGSYNTQHGKALTKLEKEKIITLYKQGYSIAEVAKKIHRSPSAVRRQVEKNELGNRK